MDTVNPDEKKIERLLEKINERHLYSDFVSNTWLIFAISVLTGFISSRIPILTEIVSNHYKIFAVTDILIMSSFWIISDKKIINAIALFLFSALTGLLMYVSMSYFFSNITDNFTIEAFSALFTIFTILSITIKITGNIPSTALSSTIAILIIFLIAIALNIFFLKLDILSTGIVASVELFFAMFMIYDTEKIIEKDLGDPVEGAITLYMDLVFIFLYAINLVLGTNPPENTR